MKLKALSLAIVLIGALTILSSCDKKEGTEEITAIQTGAETQIETEDKAEDGTQAESQDKAEDETMAESQDEIEDGTEAEIQDKTEDETNAETNAETEVKTENGTEVEIITEPATEATSAREIDPNLPVMNKVDQAGAKTADTEYFSALYDSDLWFYDATNSIGSFTLYYTGSAGGSVTSINFAYPDPVSSGSTVEEYGETVKMSIDSVGSAEITKEKIYNLNGEEILYLEMESKFTDELIDLYISMGMFTEEDITASGGREVLKKTPPTKQIAMAKVVNGMGYAVTGTCAEDGVKDEVIEALTLTMQSMKIG